MPQTDLLEIQPSFADLRPTGLRHGCADEAGREDLLATVREVEAAMATAATASQPHAVDQGTFAGLVPALAEYVRILDVA